MRNMIKKIRKTQSKFYGIKCLSFYVIAFFFFYLLFSISFNVHAQKIPPVFHQNKYSVFVNINLENETIEYCFKDNTKLINASFLNLSMYDLSDCNVSKCITCELKTKKRIWFDEIELKRFFLLSNQYVIKKSKLFKIESNNFRENQTDYIIPFEGIYDIRLKVFKIPYIIIFWYAIFIIIFIALMIFLLKD